MNAFVEFIREQMTLRGWRAADLVRASGLPKQGISYLLNNSELRRMVDDATVEGLARAFCLTEADDPTPEQYAEALRQWEQVIKLKSAEAIGVPVQEPVTVAVPREPSDEELLEMLRHRLTGRASRDGQRDPSKVDVVPNTGGADTEVGDDLVSGEKRTIGEPRVPERPQSRGSDSDDPEQRRTTKRSAPPRL